MDKLHSQHQLTSVANLKTIPRESHVWDKMRESSLSSIIMHDVCSEFDARHFSVYVDRRGLGKTNEFRRFRGVWLRDEQNHYEGFRFLASCIFDKSEQAVDVQVRVRESEFSALANYLTDDLSLHVVLCYDEMVTARAYARDMKLYDALNEPILSRWIREVTRDEFCHFLDLAKMIRKLHSDSFSKIERSVHELASLEEAGVRYGGTFVLDRNATNHEPAFFRYSAQKVLRYLRPRLVMREA